MQKKKAKTLKTKNKSLKTKKNNVRIDEITDEKYRHLKKKVRERLNTQEIEFIDNPDEIKMSAVILKLAEPYIKMCCGDETRVHSIISLTMTVWNMSFLSLEEQNELQQKCVEILPKDCDAHEIAGMLRMFDELKERKEKLFPNIQVCIMGHDLRMDKHDIHLEVSSVPLKKKD